MISSMRDGRFLAVNDAFLSVTGFAREEVVGRTSIDLGLWLDPEDRERFVSLLGSQGAVRERDLHFRVKSGDRRIGVITASVTRFEGEQVILAAVRDVTAERRAKQCQQAVYRMAEVASGCVSLVELCGEMHQMLRDLIHAENLYVAIYDRLSDTITFPYAVDEVDTYPDKPVPAGNGLTEYVIRTGEPLLASPDVWSELQALGITTAVGTDSRDWLGVPLKHEGETFGVIAVQNYNPDARLYNNDDLAVLMFVAFQISHAMQRLKAEERLRQAVKLEAVGQLSAGVAHDFNNLLSVVLGHAYLLKESKDPQVKTSAAAITNAVDRGAELIRHLLSFTRNTPVQREVVNIRMVAEECAVMLRRVIRANIDLSIEGDDAFTLVDKGALQQTIINLVLNARDAIADAGTISVQWRSNIKLCRMGVGIDELFHEITIVDSGQGMSAETRARMFEPFFTTKAFGQGTGLGLSSVYSFVKQHHGWIDVVSEEAKGTTIRVYLPAEVATPASAADSSSEAVACCSGTVLLVDDQESLRELTAQLLKQAGLSVLEARDGLHAVEVSNEFQGSIDLLLTDMIMPRLGGGDLAERIVKVRPETKVLFMSGYTDDEEWIRAVKGSHAGYIEKPFCPTDLLHAINQMLHANGAILKAAS
jgi:PAS domain S-box-containing protein